MPDTLLEALQSFDASRLLPYEAGDAQGIVATIDKHMATLGWYRTKEAKPWQGF